MLRRALGAPGPFGSDRVAAGLGPGLDVDLHAVTAEPASLLALDGELLEGISVAASPTFESWLVVERHRLAAVEARLRERRCGLLAPPSRPASTACAGPLRTRRRAVTRRCTAMR